MTTFSGSLLLLVLLMEIAPPRWHAASGLRVGYNSESTNQGAISLALEQAQRDGLLAGENFTYVPRTGLLPRVPCVPRVPSVPRTPRALRVPRVSRVPSVPRVPRFYHAYHAYHEYHAHHVYRAYHEYHSCRAYHVRTTLIVSPSACVPI